MNQRAGARGGFALFYSQAREIGQKPQGLAQGFAARFIRSLGMSVHSDELMRLRVAQAHWCVQAAGAVLGYHRESGGLHDSQWREEEALFEQHLSSVRSYLQRLLKQGDSAT